MNQPLACESNPCVISVLYVVSQLHIWPIVWRPRVGCPAAEAVAGEEQMRDARLLGSAGSRDVEHDARSTARGTERRSWAGSVARF